MRLVNEAWEVLGKPETRAEYDAVYFDWKAKEYARRAGATDETWSENRRGGEQDESRSSSGDGSEGARHSACCCWLIVLAGIAVVIAFINRDEIEYVDGNLRWRSPDSVATATRVAQVPTTPTPNVMRSTLGDATIQCVPSFLGDQDRFWASVNFVVPTSSSWSVGFLYHNPRSQSAQDLDSDAATYLYQTRLGGPYVGHWTRKDGVVEHRVSREHIHPESALNKGGNNAMRIEVNDRGSYLILNDELQVHVPVEQLNPVSSRVKFCAGFFSNEESEYQLIYSDLTGGAR